MKISVTVNLGNYENIKVESSEYVFAADCKAELQLVLEDLRMPQVDDFMRRVLHRTEGGQAGGHHPIG